MNNGNNFLAYQVWIGLHKNTRIKLAEIFKLVPTGESVVHIGAMVNGNIAGEAKSDGFTALDLQGLTVAKLQEYLDTEETDFYKMFNEVVADIEGPVAVIEEAIERITPGDIVIPLSTELPPVEKKIITKPKKNGKKNKSTKKGKSK